MKVICTVVECKVKLLETQFELESMELLHCAQFDNKPLNRVKSLFHKSFFYVAKFTELNWPRR